ncbi:hypothetical protein COO60DRAFT_1478338 [Scenedesmus sp. NREL 46B-D3]|nr:hypothetical protein COO60DRAFT_1478338 [Scenedesmus sp. NREL 46B-D3]
MRVQRWCLCCQWWIWLVGVVLLMAAQAWSHCWLVGVVLWLAGWCWSRCWLVGVMLLMAG